ncbi:twin-arginine translocation signal domain-containing protein [Leisingera sp. ANG59]|uniref:twin-arginine translocation signal domain-containing protein n=1 Tax=Leisingera sp. ANG59 TaxID=2675221 RepID=UPI001571E76A|nr:twin-arginine translocation signal domain-containing protein [Leisingera sp. ANG59]NSY39560.1 twin-arginine translocation signal domain-containing protein [Leisingera sp. ANG59]
MKHKVSSQDKTGKKAGDPQAYSRREAMKALAKYSTAVGGAAAVVVTAEGLVNEASAYGHSSWWST